MNPIKIFIKGYGFLTRSFQKRKLFWKHGDETHYHFQENNRVTVGEFTYGVPIYFDHDGDAKLTIGKYCSIADGVVILGGGKHNIDYFSTYPFYYKHTDVFSNARKFGPPSSGETVIGNDVWIGNGVTILSGVKIGDGAIIGSGAVVSKDIPSYAIAVGNPIRIIRYRFDENTINRLLASKWWDLPTDKVNELLFYLDNIEEFLKQIDRLNIEFKNNRLT